MDSMETTLVATDYTIPEGCPTCGADLPVRVSERGPVGFCRHCHMLVRPTLRVTAAGLEVEFRAAAA